MTDDGLSQRRTANEWRVRDQPGRHRRVDPNMDLKQRIKAQIVEEYERLDRIADKFESGGQHNLAEAARFLAEQWLIVLSEELEKY